MPPVSNGMLIPQRGRRAASGFSLVELSIVLVILGLLTGGILAGQSLIRAAEIRSVVSDFEQYINAVHTFRDTYDALPGDMPNATALWGAADGNDGFGNDCVNASNKTIATCNGNDNGFLYPQDGNAGCGADGCGNEAFHAWKHLAAAGLIEGSYTGRRGADPRQGIPGENSPASRIDHAGYAIESLNIGPGQVEWYPGNYDLMIFFGAPRTTLGVFEPALTPTEAWRIDTKMDDGKPGLGRLRTAHTGSCVTPNGSAHQNTAMYNLTVNSIACNLIVSLKHI